jgi:transposase
MMAPRSRPDPKRDTLRQQGALHAHPESVTDPLFGSHDFFDARDLAQVKYEMLRRVECDGTSVSQAAAAFGFSRPSFYQARTVFAEAGVTGLAHRRRGPKAAHKLTAPVREYIQQLRGGDPDVNAPTLAAKVVARFGIAIHPRTIERAVRRAEKKSP